MDACVATPRAIPLDLVPMIERVVTETKGGYRGQKIDREGPPELVALGDPDRILQVLANVVDNAAKYSPVGSPIIVTWGSEKGCAVVRVRDFGTGIQEDQWARLFTRFGRIPGSQSRAGHAGTGLGLYLAREYARAMHGDLDLESTGSDGSTFLLRLHVSVEG